MAGFHMGLPVDFLERADVTPPVTLGLFENAISHWSTAARNYPRSGHANFRILDVVHRKNKHYSEHEFLLLTILVFRSTTGQPYRCYGRVERRNHNSNSLRLRLGLGVPAKDTITFSCSPFNTIADTDKSYTLYSLSFRETGGPNLLDLAAMLTTIVALAPRYHLYTSSCYWFARMIFEGLTHTFGGTVIAGENACNRGKYARLVPVVDETASFLLGKPRALRRWERFQSAIVHDRVEAQACRMHELIDHAYSVRRAAMEVSAQQAEYPMASC